MGDSGINTGRDDVSGRDEKKPPVVPAVFEVACVALAYAEASPPPARCENQK
jgi:hypothetical protein